LTVYEERGDFQEGVERLKLAVEEYPFASIRALGRAYSLVGDTANALETLEKAINIDPSNASLYWIDIGSICESHHDKAIHAYETAVALSHEPRVGTHSLLGDFYRGKGRFRDAIVQYEYELAIEGSFREGAIRKLIEIYTETGDYDNAIQRLISAIVTYPELPYVKYLLGEVFMEVADYDSAIVAFESAIEKDGGQLLQGNLWKSIGQAKEYKSHLSGAIAYEMAVEIDSDDDECWEKLDELYETSDQVVEEKGEQFTS
jgi:tetratricopeptide (TPR) repeat protein